MSTFLSQIVINAGTITGGFRTWEKPTYPKQHVSAKKPSLVPRQEASKASRQSLAHPSQTRLAGAAQPIGYI